MNKRQRGLAGAAAQGGGRKMLKKAIAFILGLVLLGSGCVQGESGSRLRSEEAFAVTTWCEHPEAAWEVVKAFCDGSLEHWRDGIPVTRSGFEETAAEYRRKFEELLHAQQDALEKATGLF